MTEKKDDAAPEEADVPPTRKHEAVPAEPPARDSHLSLDNMPVMTARLPVQIVYAMLAVAIALVALGPVLHLSSEAVILARTFAGIAIVVALLAWWTDAPRLKDDGSVSSMARGIDHHVGHVELGALLAIFIAVVVVASASALSEHIAHHQIGLWWTWVVRKGTFAIALLGAAFATQQQRLLAMDLVSRRLSPRGRLVLGIVLKLFTMALAGVLVYIGMFMHQSADQEAGPRLHLWLFDLTEKDALMVIPMGSALIVLHSLLHAIIEADYLFRGKQLPERARSGH